MRLVLVAMCAVTLAGCTLSAPDTINAEAEAEANAIAIEATKAAAGNIVTLPTGAEIPPPYVAGPDESVGDNAMTNANPGQIYYRDLPAARLLRGDWTVRKTAWFAVSGRETEPKSPTRMAAFAGAKVRIDRHRILVTPRDAKALAKVTLDCTSVGYLDKDRLYASENLPSGTPHSREDTVINFSIAVAEREIASAFDYGQDVDLQVLSLFCPESDQGDAEEGVYPIAWLSGAMQVDRNHMVLIFTDGTLLYAERNPQ